MFDAIAGLLAWFYDIWPSYGGAIILLTLAVMIVLTPLTLRGTKSMLKMQQLQPEMKRIQKEFKDDRQRMNEELMAFYRENQINPLGGCLPLLLQMPVFIVLYQILNGLTRRGDDGTFDPKYLDHSTDLYQALDGATEMNWLGFDLSISPADAFSQDFVTFLPYLAMIVIVFLSGYVQQRQVQGRNPNASANPQAQMIGRIMPIFIAVISYGLQGALVLYFVVSNLYRVGQQWLITRTIYHDQAEAAGVIDTKGKDKDTGKDPSQGNGKGKTTPARGDTAPKGRATPPRSGGDKGKGKNKRTAGGRSTTPSLPQPRARKKKR
jgi:YidC/Oxa1 family membrane protein insertase